MKKRIWELDVFRGICILGMVLVHFIYDLVELYGIIDWSYPAVFSFVKDWGGVLFLLLSGVCATLGSRSVRRGLIVFACGLVCTAVTAGMYLLGFAGKYIIKETAHLGTGRAGRCHHRRRLLDKRHPGGMYLAVPPGADLAGILVLGLFPAASQSGLFPAGFRDRQDPLPKKRDPAAPNQRGVPGSEIPGFLRSAVPVHLPASSACAFPAVPGDRPVLIALRYEKVFP